MALTANFNWLSQTDGDTLELTNINFFDAVPVVVDMTTVSNVDMKIRRGSEKGKLVDTLAIGTGIKWIDQTLGQLRIGDTDDLIQIDWGGAGTYYYDIQFTYSTGIIRTYLRGVIPVAKDTTYA